MKKLISIVTPMYNEEENIKKYFLAMENAVDQFKNKYNFEFIIIDNCSTDRTFELLKKQAFENKNIRIFKLSKNFGYQKSIFTGYSLALGDAAVEYDADLQDPPEMLTEFIEQWERGYKIVYGIRKKRVEGVLITFMRKIFYRFLNLISEHFIPIDVGDFLLIDRQILDILRQYKDACPYLRGTIFSLGFSKFGIKYHRRARTIGKSKFSFSKKLALAVDGIISQSILPLRIASYIGLIVVTLSSVLSGVFLYLKFFTNILLPGLTTTTLLILFSVSINSLFFGIIGEYIARIYKQVNPSPITIIEKSIDRTKKIKLHQYN